MKTTFDAYVEWAREKKKWNTKSRTCNFHVCKSKWNWLIQISNLVWNSSTCPPPYIIGTWISFHLFSLEKENKRWRMNPSVSWKALLWTRFIVIFSNEMDSLYWNMGLKTTLCFTFISGFILWNAEHSVKIMCPLPSSLIAYPCRPSIFFCPSISYWHIKKLSFAS